MNSSEQCGHNELTLIDWSSLAELHNAHPTAVAVASAELRMNNVAKVATKPRTRLPELTDKVPTDRMRSDVKPPPALLSESLKPMSSYTVLSQ